MGKQADEFKKAAKDEISGDWDAVARCRRTTVPFTLY